MTDTILFTSVYLFNGSVTVGTLAVVRDGVVGWLVSDTDFRPLMRDVAEKYGVAWTPAQEAARAADVEAAILAYRAAQARMTAEEQAEQMFEARAAHGPGVEVVNIITGERHYTGD